MQIKHINEKGSVEYCVKKKPKSSPAQNPEQSNSSVVGSKDKTVRTPAQVVEIGRKMPANSTKGTANAAPNKRDANVKTILVGGMLQSSCLLFISVTIITHFS